MLITDTLPSELVGANLDQATEDHVYVIMTALERMAPTLEDIGSLSYASAQSALNKFTPGGIIAFLLVAEPETIVFDCVHYKHSASAQRAIDENVLEAPALERYFYLMELARFVKDIAFEVMLDKLMA